MVVLGSWWLGWCWCRCFFSDLASGGVGVLLGEVIGVFIGVFAGGDLS